MIQRILIVIGTLVFSPCLVSADSTPQKQQEESKTTESLEKAKSLLVPKVHWDDGLHIVAPGKRLRLKLGGEAHIDSAGFSKEGLETGLGRLENGTEWRRARFSTVGTFGKRLRFKFQYDFATVEPPHLKDAWVNFHNLPIPLEIKGGRFKAALGLENYTSGNDLSFMERGLISAFLPTRNTGALLHGDSPVHEIRWAFGVLKEEDQFGVTDTNQLSFTGRLTKAFRLTNDWLLHTGVDLAHRKVDDRVRFLERPESHIAPQFVDTREFPADSVRYLVLEGAAARGPVSIQSEFARAWVDGDSTEGQQDVAFEGFYVFGSYFFTGESRPYSAEEGRFTRVHPNRTFRDAGGWGALEMAFRFSHLNLNDNNITGGRLNDFTAGLNWYPTHNYRVMVNLIRADQNVLGTVWIVQMRLQAAF
jgi:phosphate-selective porin OprO/OprP